jgi:hypothetical protein
MVSAGTERIGRARECSRVRTLVRAPLAQDSAKRDGDIVRDPDELAPADRVEGAIHRVRPHR